MNLVVNARDAMPSGGKLTIETANVELDEAVRAAHARRRSPGRYVMLAVSDTGCGMDAATHGAHLRAVLHDQGARARAPGSGWRRCTASSSRAAATSGCTASPARARRSRSILPRVEARPGPVAPSRRRRARPREGSETVLLVEDERSVRRLARTILERHGYTCSRPAPAARTRWRRASTPAPIDLLLTDVVMPEMSGTRAGGAGSRRSARDAGALSCRATPTTPSSSTASCDRARVPPEAVHAGRPPLQGAAGAGRALTAHNNRPCSAARSPLSPPRSSSPRPRTPRSPSAPSTSARRTVADLKRLAKVL